MTLRNYFTSLSFNLPLYKLHDVFWEKQSSIWESTDFRIRNTKIRIFILPLHLWVALGNFLYSEFFMCVCCVHIHMYMINNVYVYISPLYTYKHLPWSLENYISTNSYWVKTFQFFELILGKSRKCNLKETL